MRLHITAGALAVAAAAGLLVTTPAADASIIGSQITMGNSAQNITYTGNGAGSLTVAIPAITGTAFDNVSPGLGSYALSAVTFTAGPGPNLFPTSATETKTYTNGGNSLTAAIVWNFLQDGTPQPKLFGTETISAIAGSAAFLAAFGPVGTVLGVDFTSNVLSCAVAANCATTNALSLTTTSATATISSGEEVVRGAAVPEPASLALLASGLFGLSWLGRHRNKRS